VIGLVGGASRCQTRLARALPVLQKAEIGLATIMLALMVLLVFADVCGRELFSIGVMGAQKLAVYSFIYTSFLGMAAATGSGRHLRAQLFDFATSRLAPTVISRVANVLSFLILAFLAIAGAEFAAESLYLGERGIAVNIPIWIVQAVLPYAFGSAAARHLSYAFFPDLQPGDADKETP